MGDVDEYRCFVGSLSWSTTDRDLRDAFEKFGRLIEAKVILAVPLLITHMMLGQHIISWPCVLVSLNN